MDLDKLANQLTTIESHTEHLLGIENLLEKILESNRRSETHLANMWRMYEQMIEERQRSHG